MYIKIKILFLLIPITLIFTIFAQGVEPTWLFTVPKADNLKEDQFNIGFIYAELGITDNAEIGLHGFKYSLPDSNFAFGFSLYPLLTPYIVTSIDIDSVGLHLGIKAAPYIFFAGLELPVSKKLRIIAELNNGLFFGVRILPDKHWTLDIFGLYATYEGYRYKYKKVEYEDFYLRPWIHFIYSSKL